MGTWKVSTCFLFVVVVLQAGLVAAWIPCPSRILHSTSSTTTRLGAAANKSPSTETTTSSVDSPSATPSDESNHDDEPSSIFGTLYPLGLPGDEEEEETSFLGTMGVPTYASATDHELQIMDVASRIFPTTMATTTRRGLEGVLQQGPAFMLDDVLSKEACEAMIQECDAVGFGTYQSGRNFHGALQILVSQTLADAVAHRLASHIDVSQVQALRTEMKTKTKKQPQAAETTTSDDDDDDTAVRLVFAGLNRRWRIYRYESSGKDTFAPHIDAGFPPSGVSDDGRCLLWGISDQYNEPIVSRLTVLLYLNDDFIGGETNFYEPLAAPKAPNNNNSTTSKVVASVRPIAGSCLVFPQGVGEAAVDYARQHWPLHEGSPVVSGRPKYVIRSDVLFGTQREETPFDEDLLIPYARLYNYSKATPTCLPHR